MSRPSSIELLGVSIDTLSLAALLDQIAVTAVAGRRLVVMNVNAHALNLAVELPKFRAILNSADIVFCDGYGVKLGALLQGKRIPHRYTPPDWIPCLANLCVTHNLSLYFLGAKPGVAQTAALRLQRKHPGLRIAGSQHGYFDKRPNSPVNAQVLEHINDSAPDILIVGFGMPSQEEWVADNWANLNVRVVLTAGAVFDYLAGSVLRAPRWITDAGLEWLGRLVIEPRRLWRRYLFGNVYFIWRVLLERFGALHLE
jgi:N-acetylglucosaminyldiphosphoundecaprenol N-acetyl-beta-D-mannosaminyltransferase